jgi:hypothetical protein
LSLRAEPELVAHDNASNAAYFDGWKNVEAKGFGEWAFQETISKDQSYAGHFIADRDQNEDLDHCAIDNKAFGLFANGTGFEQAVAFRAFKEALQAGDTFTILLEHGEIGKKFESDDDAKGAIGFALRSGNETGSVNDYKTGARFILTFKQGGENYVITDSEESFDTEVPWSDAGMQIKFTLTGDDSYDLEVTTLATMETKKFANRNLGGDSAKPIESVALFNRDGEKSDAFFNSLRVERAKTEESAEASAE